MEKVAPLGTSSTKARSRVRATQPAPVRHRTVCRCDRCFNRRLKSVAIMRRNGQSITTIAAALNVGWATAWRYLKLIGEPAPPLTEGRNGKQYKPRR